MNEQKVFGKPHLYDGISNVFTYSGHLSKIKGVNIVTGTESKRPHHSEVRSTISQFYSWDEKSIHLWEYDADNVFANPPSTEPGFDVTEPDSEGGGGGGEEYNSTTLVKSIKFPRPSFIPAVVFVGKLKIFLACALDMTFRIYDAQLNLLEVIRHEERALLALEYIESKDMIIAAGAGGISAWRVSRGASLSQGHIIDRLFYFKGCESIWATKLIVEPSTNDGVNRLYATVDTSIYTLSLNKKCIIDKISNTADSPFTACVFYPRNQYYVTGCSQGLIRCWSKSATSSTTTATATTSASETGKNNRSNNNNSRDINSNGRTAYRSFGKGDDSGGGEDGFDLHRGNNFTEYSHVFTFHVHTEAVSGLLLHPTSGLIISTSHDGFLKVLNMEALTVLINLNLNSAIMTVRPTVHSASGYNALLLTLNNGTIRFFNLTPCATLFGVSTQQVNRVEIFENTHRYQLQQSLEETAAAAANKGTENGRDKEELREETERVGFSDRSASPNKDGGTKGMLTNGQYRGTSSREDGGSGQKDSDDEDDESKSEEEGGAVEDEESEIEAVQKKIQEEALKLTLEEAERKKKEIHWKYIVSSSNQDLRVFTESGDLQAVLDPQSVTETVKSFVVSPLQQLLICLFEDGPVKFYCIRNITCDLIYELPMRNFDVDKGSCLCLCDTMPLSTVHESGIRSLLRRDLRGDEIHHSLDELMIMATASGSLYLFDLFKECGVVQIVHTLCGAVSQLKYRSARRELLVLGTSLCQRYNNLRIWILPEMICTHELDDLSHISCFAVSPMMSLFGLGCTDGFVRLFHASTVNVVSELDRQSQPHNGAVTCMDFCDSLQVYTTCSVDLTVAVWTYDQQFIRCISFHKPSCCVLFTGDARSKHPDGSWEEGGDIIISQNHYILNLPRKVWDGGNFLNFIKASRPSHLRDEWAKEVLEGGVAHTLQQQEEAEFENQLAKLGLLPGLTPSQSVSDGECNESLIHGIQQSNQSIIADSQEISGAMGANDAVINKTNDFNSKKATMDTFTIAATKMPVKHRRMIPKKLSIAPGRKRKQSASLLLSQNPMQRSLFVQEGGEGGGGWGGEDKELPRHSDTFYTDYVARLRQAGRPINVYRPRFLVTEKPPVFIDYEKNDPTESTEVPRLGVNTFYCPEEDLHKHAHGEDEDDDDDEPEDDTALKNLSNHVPNLSFGVSNSHCDDIETIESFDDPMPRPKSQPNPLPPQNAIRPSWNRPVTRPLAHSQVPQISPVVSEEYKMTRGVTFGLDCGSISRSPSMQIEPSSGSIKIIPFSTISQESNASPRYENNADSEDAGLKLRGQVPSIGVSTMKSDGVQVGNVGKERERSKSKRDKDEVIDEDAGTVESKDNSMRQDKNLGGEVDRERQSGDSEEVLRTNQMNLQREHLPRFAPPMQRKNVSTRKKNAVVRISQS